MGSCFGNVVRLVNWLLRQFFVFLIFGFMKTLNCALLFNSYLFLASLNLIMMIVTFCNFEVKKKIKIKILLFNTKLVYTLTK